MFSEHSQRDERRTRDGRAGVWRSPDGFARDGMGNVSCFPLRGCQEEPSLEPYTPDGGEYRVLLTILPERWPSG